MHAYTHTHIHAYTRRSPVSLPMHTPTVLYLFHHLDDLVLMCLDPSRALSGSKSPCPSQPSPTCASILSLPLCSQCAPCRICRHLSFPVPGEICHASATQRAKFSDLHPPPCATFGHLPPCVELARPRAELARPRARLAQPRAELAQSRDVPYAILPLRSATVARWTLVGSTVQHALLVQCLPRTASRALGAIARPPRA